ncbi:MAG: hypothetical protein JSV86_16030 [Gemmatimonadota bacterium]|jgi:hypothetical protein|nr:MAG: hypothetical protein JSV86_16030 [Gemmatimonadota bacterium]
MTELIMDAIKDVGVPTVLLVSLCVVIYKLALRAMPMAAQLVDAHVGFVRSQADTNKRLEALLQNLVSQVASLDERIGRLEKK